jgi:hypothetical protein
MTHSGIEGDEELLLKSGNPPDDWDELLSEARKQNKRTRVARERAR